jgi:hypothetical protein
MGDGINRNDEVAEPPLPQALEFLREFHASRGSIASGFRPHRLQDETIPQKSHYLWLPTTKKSPRAPDLPAMRELHSENL